MHNEQEMYFVNEDGEISCHYDIEQMIDLLSELGYQLVTPKEHHKIIKDIKSVDEIGEQDND